jgi:hypothetical protein
MTRTAVGGTAKASVSPLVRLAARSSAAGRMIDAAIAARVKAAIASLALSETCVKRKEVSMEYVVACAYLAA